MNIIVPMAGRGSRMNSVLPKFMLQADNKSMLEQVIESINIHDANYFFVVQQSHYNKYDLKNWLNNICEAEHVIVRKETRGPAHTALMAAGLLKRDDPVLIVDCDNYFRWDPSKCFEYMKRNVCDGFVLTFKSDNPKYSYVELDEFGVANRFIEKKSISDNAIAGVYYWSKSTDFVKSAKLLSIKQNTELFISQAYNLAIEDGKIFRNWQVEDFQCLGTEEDLKFFNKRKGL